MSDQHSDVPSVTETTREEERRTAAMGPDAGLMPTEDEEAAAERAEVQHDPEAGRNEAEFNEMAAKHPGEGRVEG